MKPPWNFQRGGQEFISARLLPNPWIFWRLSVVSILSDPKKLLSDVRYSYIYFSTCTWTCPKFGHPVKFGHLPVKLKSECLHGKNNFATSKRQYFAQNRGKRIIFDNEINCPTPGYCIGYPVVSICTNQKCYYLKG